MQSRKEYKRYWGDLHNHNAVGYAKGSLERSIEIAQGHLDFFAFTGHSQWHDIRVFENDAHMHWIKGFQAHQAHWEKTQDLIAQANRPGQFVSFLGYEWHSSRYGDYCLIYPDDYRELAFSQDIRALQRHAKEAGALIIPHHIAYQKGKRGINWDVFQEATSPVTEIFSEHGCCERDEGPYPMIRHGMGGRTSGNTFQDALARGFHLGVTASSDSHTGYPGAYGEGLTAVLAQDLSRESLWEALQNRRVYAVTGDRIALDFTVNGQPMGSILDACGERRIAVTVRGWDALGTVELLKNNQVIHRCFGQENPLPGNKVLIRVEYGWGPWSDLKMPRICDWAFALSLDQARITDHCTCFQSGPFSEARRNQILHQAPELFQWISHTSRKGAFEERPTNALVLEIQGEDAAILTLQVKKPTETTLQVPLGAIRRHSISAFMGEYPAEQVLIHRAVEEQAASAAFELTDPQSSGRQEDFYYVRVTQDNGQMAWSSPIWVRN